MRNLRTVCLTLALIVWMLSGTGCAAPILRQDGTCYIDQSTGLSYSYAPYAYVAVSVSDDVYARIEREKAGELLLYSVEGLPSERYLATADGMLLCSSDLTLPELFELPVCAVSVHELRSQVTVARVTAAQEITALKTAWRSGVFFSLDDVLPSLRFETYEVRFLADAEYAGLSYRLKYLQCQQDVLIYDAVEDQASYVSIYEGIPYTVAESAEADRTELYAVYNFGKALLYDSASGRCCMAGDVLAAYLGE